MTFEEILPGLRLRRIARAGWGGAENCVQLFIPIGKEQVALEVTRLISSSTSLVRVKVSPCGVQPAVMSLGDRLGGSPLTKKGLDYRRKFRD